MKQDKTMNSKKNTPDKCRRCYFWFLFGFLIDCGTKAFHNVCNLSARISMLGASIKSAATQKTVVRVIKSPFATPSHSSPKSRHPRRTDHSTAKTSHWSRLWTTERSELSGREHGQRSATRSSAAQSMASKAPPETRRQKRKNRPSKIYQSGSRGAPISTDVALHCKYRMETIL